ncbi:MAG: hypothetical protein B7Y32_06570 [Methylophilales bacterium 16-45-7]|jgi:uncharacterized repeat protein (TIGR03837 family)|nr:MAG: hypothetical protein B7Y32_06570 [Methylophilales bacterium 16-45-7]
MSAKQGWDIFCKVVDNFGDIGVSWRLARQLRQTHNLTVKLWVDDLQVAQRMMPAIDINKSSQVVDEVTVYHWHAHADFSQAADVVIESFACELPVPYLAAMQAQSTTWINLEYLSAEPWVADFHAKASPQNNGLIRYFYFPGFTENTGGLLSFGMHSNVLSNTKQLFSKPPKSAFKISLFCYPHAPIHDLLRVMEKGSTPIHCYVPATSILPQVASYFALPNLVVGQTLQSANLTVEVLPFLSQDNYDALLAHCDINFVRGEDSWIRAIWASKPFIWQPYFQEDHTHMQKLNAFIKQFYANAPTDIVSVIQTMHESWVCNALSPQVWQGYLAELEGIKSVTQDASQALQQQSDLASKLVIFCNNL